MIISAYIRQVVAKMNVSYDHSSTQVDFPGRIASDIMTWGQKNIPEGDLHNDGKDTKGREDNIHVTLLYGLKTTNPEDVRRVLSGMKPFRIRLGLISAFMDKPAYDVIKIDIEAPELYQMHYRLRGALANDNKFPSYAPHATICYVKKGKALPYLGNDTFRDVNFYADGVLFSSSTGERIPITFK